MDKFRRYRGGDSKVGARELIHIDHTTTAMAGVGRWKDHWEVLPIGQLVFFYIFVFRDRAGPLGPVGSEGWGTEGRLQVLESWEGEGGQAGGLA